MPAAAAWSPSHHNSRCLRKLNLQARLGSRPASRSGGQMWNHACGKAPHKAVWRLLVPCCGSQWRAAVMDHGTVLLKAHLHPGLIHLSQPGIPSSGSTAVPKPPPSELCQSLSCHTHLTCVFAATRRCHTHAHALVIYSLCLQSICMLCDHRNLPGRIRARPEFVCDGAEMSPARFSWGEAQASMDVKSRPNPVPPAEQRGLLLHLRTPGFRSVIRPHQRPDGHGRVEARPKCEETGRVADPVPVPVPVPVPDPVPVPVPVPVPARRRPAAPSRRCCRCTAVKRRRAGGCCCGCCVWRTCAPGSLYRRSACRKTLLIRRWDER